LSKGSASNATTFEKYRITLKEPIRESTVLETWEDCLIYDLLGADVRPPAQLDAQGTIEVIRF